MNRTTRISLALLFLGAVAFGAQAQSQVSNPNPSVQSSPSPSQVSNPSPGVSSGLVNPLKDNDLTSLLADVLQFVMLIGGMVVVLMLVYCGFLFIKAQGNAEKIQEARQMLLWTVVGALIILGASAIQAGIQATVQALSS